MPMVSWLLREAFSQPSGLGELLAIGIVDPSSRGWTSQLTVWIN